MREICFVYVHNIDRLQVITTGPGKNIGGMAGSYSAVDDFDV